MAGPVEQALTGQLVRTTGEVEEGMATSGTSTVLLYDAEIQQLDPHCLFTHSISPRKLYSIQLGDAHFGYIRFDPIGGHQKFGGELVGLLLLSVVRVEI